jgi:hypothetical protein
MRSGRLRARDQVEIAVIARYEEDALARDLVEEWPELAAAAARPADTAEERRRLDELMSRVVEVKRADDSAVLIDTLAPLVLEVVSADSSGDRTVLSAVFVVERERLSEVEAALEAFRERSNDCISLTVTKTPATPPPVS